MAPKDKARAYRLMRLYGITLEQYGKMLERQGGKCAICSNPPKKGSRRLAVDHCHDETKRVRGLLCFVCNRRFLGRGRENPVYHRIAADYLESTFDGREV